MLTVWCTLSRLEKLREGNPVYFLVLKYHKMVILETFPFITTILLQHKYCTCWKKKQNKTKQIRLKFVESVGSFHELMRPFDWLTTTLTKMPFDPDFQWCLRSVSISWDTNPEVGAWQISICDCWEFNDFPLLKCYNFLRAQHFQVVLMVVLFIMISEYVETEIELIHMLKKSHLVRNR